MTVVKLDDTVTVHHGSNVLIQRSINNTNFLFTLLFANLFTMFGSQFRNYDKSVTVYHPRKILKITVLIQNFVNFTEILKFLNTETNPGKSLFHIQKFELFAELNIGVPH